MFKNFFPHTISQMIQKKYLSKSLINKYFSSKFIPMKLADLGEGTYQLN